MFATPPRAGNTHRGRAGEIEWTLVTLETHPRWWWPGSKGPTDPAGAWRSASGAGSCLAGDLDLTARREEAEQGSLEGVRSWRQALGCEVH